MTSALDGKCVMDATVAADPSPTPTLVCRICRAPVAAAPDLIMTAYVEGRGTLWYPHELDLLDVEDVPTYGGAKDPTGVVDNYVVRVLVSERTRAALGGIPGYEGEEPSSLNTWFPPYQWSIVCCTCCHGHLGWLFTPRIPISSCPLAPGDSTCSGADTDLAPTAPTAPTLEPFFGLRVINLRDSRVPPQTQ